MAFPITMAKHWTETSEGFVKALSVRVELIMVQEFTLAGHILSAVRNQRKMNAGVAQSNLFKDTLRSSQRYVSMVILEPFKLTMKINHHQR